MEKLTHYRHTSRRLNYEGYLYISDNKFLVNNIKMDYIAKVHVDNKFVCFLVFGQISDANTGHIIMQVTDLKSKQKVEMHCYQQFQSDWKTYFLNTLQEKTLSDIVSTPRLQKKYKHFINVVYRNYIINTGL
jgi:hypothetical protein